MVVRYSFVLEVTTKGSASVPRTIRLAGESRQADETVSVRCPESP